MLSSTISQPDLQIAIILVVMGCGVFCLLAGLLVLIGRGFSREMKVIASTSTELGKRAISHDMTALANSVSEILGLINQMMKTSAGIGAYLVLIGLGMMAASYWLTLQL